MNDSVLSIIFLKPDKLWSIIPLFLLSPSAPDSSFSQIDPDLLENILESLLPELIPPTLKLDLLNPTAVLPRLSLNEVSKVLTSGSSWNKIKTLRIKNNSMNLNDNSG